MEFSSAFSSAFAGRYAGSGGGYITPMMAQEALFAGAEWSFSDGVLSIGGRVLVGLSGNPYAFRSAQTADTWCTAGRRVIEAERATVDRLGADARERWIERKREKLFARADAVLSRAAKQNNEEKRSALLEEAALCQVKWG